MRPTSEVGTKRHFAAVREMSEIGRWFQIQYSTEHLLAPLVAAGRGDIGPILDQEMVCLDKLLKSLALPRGLEPLFSP
jgi:hypothetical protein